jgi:hypothetical protein
MTVNEKKEALVQLYAYAGFPRSLNALNIFMTIVEERKAKGIKDFVGREASPVAGVLCLHCKVNSLSEQDSLKKRSYQYGWN